MPQFHVQQGIQPGSIHDLIIRDKMREDAILKLAIGIALAIVAVALAVVTFGAATPGIIAAGAALAGGGLGVYMALEEYQEYTQQKDLADVGLADDPRWCGSSSQSSARAWTWRPRPRRSRRWDPQPRR